MSGILACMLGILEEDSASGRWSHPGSFPSEATITERQAAQERWSHKEDAATTTLHHTPLEARSQEEKY